MNEVNEIIAKLNQNEPAAYDEAISHIRKLFKELKDIRFALDQSTIVAVTDRTGTILSVNDKFCEISKYTRDELIGQTHRIINSGYHDREFFHDMWRTIGRGNIWEGQICNQAKDGSHYWVQTTIVPFLDDAGKPERYVAIRTDITKQKEVEQQIYKMAHYDVLTGLANRRQFEQVLKRDMKNENITQLAVAFVDLDRFSVINDTYGHKAGDEVLVEVGRRLDDWQRKLPSAIASRYGGDEFILLVRNRDVETVYDDLHEVQHLVSEPIVIEDEEIQIAASIGMAFYPEDGLTSDELIRNADMAMYNAKHMESKLIFHYKEYETMLNREALIDKALLQAMEAGQFSLHYQPRVDIQTSQTVAIEALLRWNHPELGEVSPEEFIPIAEKNELIVKIGAWVLERALAQLAVWHANGWHNMIISVNVSPIQLRNSYFVQMVTHLLELHQIDPAFLEIEITESVALKRKKEVQRKLEALRTLGVKVAVDDFGTGYTSLSDLRSFPLDTLKIDRELVSDYDVDNESVSLLPGIISIGHALGLSVVAEGVETLEQLQYLRRIGCDSVQGFVYSKPVPAEQCEALLENGLGKAVYSIER